jgi:hypothetical protein
MQRITRYRIIGWCIAVFACCIFRRALSQAVPTVSNDISAHGPALGGLRLTAVMEKHAMKLGEPLDLDVIVENLSQNERGMEILDPEHAFLLTIGDSKGEAVQWTKRGKAKQVNYVNRTSFVNDVSLGTPAKTAFRYRLRLDELADLTEPGEYTVSVSIKVVGPVGINPPELEGQTLKSNEVSFVITEPDPIN